MTNKITREQFMDFFRSDQFHELLTPDDTTEIFVNVLHGSSDITIELLQEVVNNYSAGLQLKNINTN